MHYIVSLNDKGIATNFEGKERVYSNFDMMVADIDKKDNEAVFIREDRVSSHDSMLNALFDFDSMSRSEMRVIHARSHSRRNAYSGCAYCVRDFIDPDSVNDDERVKFVRPVSARMSHNECAHENTKNARAKCRRDRARAAKGVEA